VPGCGQLKPGGIWNEWIRLVSGLKLTNEPVASFAFAEAVPEPLGLDLVLCAYRWFMTGIRHRWAVNLEKTGPDDIRVGNNQGRIPTVADVMSLNALMTSAYACKTAETRAMQ